MTRKSRRELERAVEGLTPVEQWPDDPATGGPAEFIVVDEVLEDGSYITTDGERVTPPERTSYEIREGVTAGFVSYTGGESEV